MSEPLIDPRRVARNRHAARAVLAGAFAAFCLTQFAPALADDDSGQIQSFLSTLKRARLIDLSHNWEITSPVASVNPFYSFALSATHANTRGAFGPFGENPVGQLSFTAEVQHFSGQHGAPSIDAIGHIGRDGKLFGGVDAAAATSNPNGIGASGFGANLAIDKFPSDLLINRGVLLDVATLVRGDSRPLPADFEITSEHLRQAARQQGVRLKKGDTVFIRTGWGQYFKGGEATYNGAFSPGPSLDAANYLIGNGARVEN